MHFMHNSTTSNSEAEKLRTTRYDKLGELTSWRLATQSCLPDRTPMTGYELARPSIRHRFFWKATSAIYRELCGRATAPIQGREVVQSGKPNKLSYTLTPEAAPR